jgi:hypothetical protein
MNFILKNKTKILWSIFITLFGLNIISMLFFGTITSGDSIRGIEMMYQYANGASWNTLNYPSVHHSDFSYFVAWWSPAQWYLPYLILKLFHIESIQFIQFILISFCLFISISGYFKLFLKFGFSINITLISLISIVTCESFYWNFIGYYGGSLFLLGFFPFFILLLLKINENTNLKNLFLFIAACVFGLFLKNTFLILIVSSCFYFIANNYTNKNPFSHIKKNLPFIFSAGIIALTVHFFFLSLGQNPSDNEFEGSYSNIKNDLIGDLTYGLGSPMGIFSRFTMLSHKIYFSLFSNTQFANFLQLIPFGFTFLFLFKFPKNKHREYFNILLLFCVPVFLIFTFSYLLNKDISYASRHFGVFAFLFFPGIIYWINSFKYKNLIYSFLIIVTFYDCRVNLLSQLVIQNDYSAWNSIKFPTNEVEALKEIEIWDQKNKNGLLIVEDKWTLSLATEFNDKIVIKEATNNIYHIESGIPLKEPDCFNFTVQSLRKFKTLLLVVPNSSKRKLIKELTTRSIFLISKETKMKKYTLIYFYHNPLRRDQR